MLYSYFKLAWRNLLKNKVFSSINILGLSMAIGCAITVFIFIDYAFNRDHFHENGEEVFLVENLIDHNGRQQVWGDSPLPLGNALANDFPQIKRVVRVRDGSGKMAYGDKIFNEGIRYVDDGFFDMFTFPLKYGDKSALKDKDQVILSYEVATKFFGDTNPVGEQIKITYNDTSIHTFLVGGVGEEKNPRASFGYNILINFQKLEDLNIDVNDWSKWIRATFIQVENPEDLAEIKTGMAHLLERQNEASQDWQIQEFLFDNLYDLANNSYDVNGDISNGVHPASSVTLTMIAVFFCSWPALIM